MNSYANLRIERDSRGVARLELNRPDKHNAFNSALISDLRAAAAELDGDDRVRVVVLAAAGKSFCAGGDLGWMREQGQNDRASRMDEAMNLANMLGELDRLSKPLIGRVQGNAFGGGLGLMAVCDAVVAAQTARFALTEVTLGLVPATIGPYVVRRIGEGHARRIFMSGRVFDAGHAKEIGLVSVVAAGDLDAAVEAEVAAYFKCAPGAVAATKTLCLRVARDNSSAIAAWTAACLADRWETDEGQEGIRCFFAGERAPWVMS